MYVPDPYEKLKKLRKRMHWDFPDIFGREFDFYTAEARIPLADLRKYKNELVLTVEMPGLRKEDIKVDLSGSGIRISGGSKAGKEEKGKGFYHKERLFSAFSRELALPEEVDPSSAKAKYENGVLEIRMKVKSGQKRKGKQLVIR
ncbi:MAG: Hsp20/alpha crystallin family protein [Candidatus ainarchaeum sp.]|nr:Hsp20/alpha crystallin family protein [Candidatus ainarchaeum sp.]